MTIDYAGQRILITGASAGIGKEMARQLAARQPKCLILVARRADQLEALKQELLSTQPELCVEVCPCDLSELAAIEQLVKRVLGKFGAIDILINNAGSGDYELFENEDWASIERMIRLNITGLTYLSHRLVGPMIALGRGGILNVSSVLGLLIGPGRAVYAASKHYVTALSEALRIELRGTGVSLSQVCPGPVESEFAAIAGSASSRPGWLEIDATTCARESLQGFAAGKALIVPDLRMRVAAALVRALPRPLKRLVFAKVRRKLLAAQTEAVQPAPGPKPWTA